VAKATDAPVLLLAPLAVSHQFAREAAKFGVPARVVKDRADVGPGINVTNYHKLHHFDPAAFGAVALDESSILKNYTAATRTELIDAFRDTPYRLALTATPSPNDHTELGNHAEFLGVMSRTEMLAMFFVHDGETSQEWRLKGHAETAFWRWVASWAVAVRRPSDLGYDDGAYDLPPLRMHQHETRVDQSTVFATGALFAADAVSLSEQRAVRKATIDARVGRCADIVARAEGPCVVWCDLNAEGDALEASIPDAVQVSGADSDEEKERKLAAFSDGSARVIVTKPSVAGFGLNWQHAHTVVYCGVTHSFEAFYQSVRRCYRFGQTMPVDVHVVTAETEGRILESLNRKQADAAHMGDAMVRAMAEITKSEIKATGRTFTAYQPTAAIRFPQWVRTESEAT
jgi:superfamily II DNA or RNA helicase